MDYRFDEMLARIAALEARVTALEASQKPPPKKDKAPAAARG